MSRHPIGTPRGLSSNAAVMAVSAWLSSRGLVPPMGHTWSIEVAFEISVGGAAFGATETGTRFTLRVLSEEWGYSFCHGGRMSTIRVVDVPFVHDRDDHQLLASTPALKELGAFVRKLEQRHAIFFPRQRAAVRTTLAGAEPAVLAWAKTL